MAIDVSWQWGKAVGEAVEFDQGAIDKAEGRVDI
jgi:hypothetical protein